MPDFRVYYDDREPYTGSPWEAPAFGVLVIVEKDKDHGRRIVSGGDYYVWRDERWWSVDWIGMVDYLQQPGWKRVLFGRMVNNDLWNAIFKVAYYDPDFPTKTASGLYERRLPE